MDREAARVSAKESADERVQWKQRSRRSFPLTTKRNTSATSSGARVRYSTTFWLSTTVRTTRLRNARAKPARRYSFIKRTAAKARQSRPACAIGWADQFN